MLTNVQEYIDGLLWRSRTGEHPLLTFARSVARYPYAVFRDALEGQLTMRAMSLVYTTLLSIVPLIALSFSILKAFDVQSQMEPLLRNFLSPLGTEQAAMLTSEINSYVDNVQGVALTSFGLAFLLYTVVSMIQKVEESVNYVWQVQRTRSFARRFSEYLSILLIAPVLMVTATALTSLLSDNDLTVWLTEIKQVKDVWILIGKATPVIALTALFSFIYKLIPNTQVKLLPALAGGLTAAIIWVTVGAAFASFVATSFERYAAIYSTFAAVIVVLIWLYANWLILLIGAKISFYVQNPEYLRYGHHRVELGNALMERLAMQLMARVGTNFARGEDPLTANDLATHLGLPGRSILPVTEKLEEAKLLLATDGDLLVPGRALDAITLRDVLAAVRDQPPRTRLPHRLAPPPAPVDDVLTRIDDARSNVLCDVTLGDLVREAQQKDAPETD